jgi:hypothetical protein
MKPHGRAVAFSRYAAEDRGLRLAEARELVGLLAADEVGWHGRVAQLRLKWFLRARQGAESLRPDGLGDFVQATWGLWRTTAYWGVSEIMWCAGWR